MNRDTLNSTFLLFSISIVFLFVRSCYIRVNCFKFALITLDTLCDTLFYPVGLGEGMHIFVTLRNAVSRQQQQ